MDAPLYLYTGPEFGEKNDAITSLKNALKKSCGEIDEYLFYATETPLAEIMTILQSASLFTSASFIVLRAAESIKKKEDIELISNWLKGAETSTLVLVTDEISVDSKLDKLVPSSHKKIFWEMFEDRKIPWLESLFKKNGYSIQSDAAEDILDMVENNTQALRQECSRFFILFPKGHEITSDNVHSVLIDSRPESAFTLFEAMTESATDQHKLEQALSILQKIRLSKDASPVMIIAGLASCFRRLQVWHKLLSEYKTDDITLKKYGFSSKKIKSQYSRASSIWTSGQCVAILSLLASTDMFIRSGGTSIEDSLLQKMIYEIIIKKGASSAIYE
ncbi:MAG: DNA polymerase III subunit delta [Treponema sp.]|nr:DNA polymerase III subunit delta [Treponema sp.]